MSNRAKEIYEAAVQYEAKAKLGFQEYAASLAREIVWLAQCTGAERAEALRMLDARAAGRST